MDFIFSILNFWFCDFSEFLWIFWEFWDFGDFWGFLLKIIKNKNKNKNKSKQQTTLTTSPAESSLSTIVTFLNCCKVICKY